MDNQLEKQLRDTRNGGGEGEARNIKVALLKMIKQCKKEYIKKGEGKEVAWEKTYISIFRQEKYMKGKI